MIGAEAGIKTCLTGIFYRLRKGYDAVQVMKSELGG